MADLTQEHRMNSINEVKNKLQAEADMYKKKLSKNKKKISVLHGISVSSGSLAGASSIATLAAAASPIVIIPTASVSAILGAISFVTGLGNKLLLN